jgi:hypothetical protein
MEKSGEWVIVRAFDGSYLLRRVWGAYSWAVEVTGDAQYQDLAAGRKAPSPIPFPLEDVFMAEDDAAAALRAGKPIDPARLHHWVP